MATGTGSAFSSNHIKEEQVDQMYKTALYQTETRLLEAHMNRAMQPDNEAAEQAHVETAMQLRRLEEDYQRWRLTTKINSSELTPQ